MNKFLMIIFLLLASQTVLAAYTNDDELSLEYNKFVDELADVYPGVAMLNLDNFPAEQLFEQWQEKTTSWGRESYFTCTDFLASVIGEFGIALMLTYKAYGVTTAEPFLWSGASCLLCAGLYGLGRVVCYCTREHEVAQRKEWISRHSIQERVLTVVNDNARAGFEF